MNTEAKSLLGIDQKSKHIWLQGESSLLFVSLDQLTEIRIIKTVAGVFNIYAKVNLIYRFEDHLLDVKKTLAAAKKFVEDFIKESQKEEYVKDLTGTKYIKKKSVIGYSVENEQLLAILENGSTTILATYSTPTDAKEALDYFIETGNYKKEKIKLDETSLKAMDALVTEINPQRTAAQSVEDALDNYEKQKIKL